MSETTPYDRRVIEAALQEHADQLEGSLT